MNSVFKAISFSVSVFFFSSCSSNGNEETAMETQNPLSLKDSTLQKGVSIPKINCRKDSVINYALYLPKKYNLNENFPVIFLFDSHGSGLLPVEKYKALAEKYGYILAGSNNSKNGMNWEQNNAQIQVFINDVKERLNIDLKRIYACGFSGGARVASSVAIFDGGVAGVIGMGAGFPSLSEPIHNKFDYIAFAGNEDFNMNELIMLSSSLDKTPLRHQLIVFNGKHEWAPDSIAEDAFLWCEVNAMRDGLISKNDTLVKRFISKNESRIAKSKDVYAQFLLCNKIFNFMSGLDSVSSFNKKAKELYNSDAMKKVLSQKEKLANEEMSTQDVYRNNFLLKDINWWTAEIKKLNQSKNSKDEHSQMNKRLLSFLSLLAYMNCSSDLQQKQYDLLEKHLRIYEMAEPDNPEHQVMYAMLYSAQKKDEEGMKSLTNAFRLGFDDVPRIQSDPLLNKYDWKKAKEEASKK
jgi:dienelactone hydrolase